MDNNAKLNEISKTFNQIMDNLKNDQEQYWNSLSKEDQLKCFCAVARRIHKGDIEDRGSYRYVLYNVFEFGPESYAQAQLAGYLSIHNSIMGPDQERKLLLAFAKHLGSENPDDSVSNFYGQTY